jgi:magnesium chelatase family protein
MEVAATGGHSFMLIGPSVKDMMALARRFKTIYEGDYQIVEDATNSKLYVNGSIPLLIAMMWPCQCGNFTHPKKMCKCTPVQIQHHLGSIPSTILDRTDIHIEVPFLNKEYAAKRIGEPSEDISKRVVIARGKILEWRKKLVPAITGDPDMDKEAGELLKLAILELGISPKAYDKMMRVAMTIAAMDDKGVIEAHHISEAISYRSLDRNLWG